MAKVLLVEDDNNLREIFEMRLQAEGYDTASAADGEEALVVAMKQKPDLIIADVMMPKLSGFEMLETLRATPEMSSVKVIMMTALGQAEDRARGEKLGVVKYLVKSQVTLEDFVRVVQEVLKPNERAAGSPGAPGSEQAAAKNNQESENSMQDDQSAPTNPAMPGGDAPAAGPAGDSAAPADPGMGGDSSAMPGAPAGDSAAPADPGMGGDSSAMPGAPAGDSGAGDAPADPTAPPAAPGV